MNRQKDEMTQVRSCVADYVSANGITNTRDIADYVASQTGIVPSTATVSKILQELGYLPHRQPSFIWRHKKNHE